LRYNLLEDLKVKEDPYDWFQAVPEAHDLSGAAAARYLGKILHAPVAWMDQPLDVVDVPEAFGAEPHETPTGELPTFRGMLSGLGRVMGESGLLGAEASPEDPWGGYELTPEILQEALPLAVELAAYPTGVRAITEGAVGMARGAEAILARAAAPYQRAAARVAEAYRRARLPARLAKSQERLTSLGEEAMRGAEWWRDVNEAQKLAMLDRAEQQISHTLDWVESSLIAEDEMAMDLATRAQGRIPTMTAPELRAQGRVPPPAESTPEVLERISTHEPRSIPPLEPTDPYAYMGEEARDKLLQIAERRRASIKHGMNRAKMRATASEKRLLNEMEAAGVDYTDPRFDETLSVEPDKFNRVKRSFEDNMRQGIPPKLVTEIHDRRIPELIGDPRYSATGQALKRRQSMAAALNEGLPKGQHITAEEILQAGKDPNLREKLAKLMARNIRNQPWYKNREQGFMEMSLLMRLGEMGLGAVTGAAVDEENRLRGAAVGALVAFTLGTVLRFGRGLGQRGAVGRFKFPHLEDPSTGRPLTKFRVKEGGRHEWSFKIPVGRRRARDVIETPEGTRIEPGKFRWDLEEQTVSGHIVEGYDPTKKEWLHVDTVDSAIEAEEAVARWEGMLREEKKSLMGVLSNERGTWNIRQMQEEVVRAAEIEGPEVMRKPLHTRAETKTRGARRDLQKKMFAKAVDSGMGRDGLRAWTLDTYGKGLSEMTEAEMVVANQDLTRRMALSKMFPEDQLDTAVKIRNIEDLSMELHGSKAQKRIDAAVRRVTGAHRDLRELNKQDLTSVLEVLPKRFLRTRGLGALIRQPLAVEDVMNRMGTWGKYITRQVRRERLHTDYLWSKWFTPLAEDVKNLTPSQMDEIVAALHPMEANGRRVVMPQDPKLQAMAVRIRQDLNEIGTLRQEIGDPVRLANGGERPFEMMDDYYPLHIPPDELTSSIQIKRRIIEHLMETGQASGPTEALTIYNDFIRKNVTNKFGNLDYAREAWIEPEKFDLFRDLSRYYYGSARRISRHKFYGGTGSTQLPKKMTTWLDALRQDVGPDEYIYAHQAMTRHFKHEAVDDAMSDMLKRIRSFETVAHMGLAQIMNSSEPVHTAVFAGFHNFAKGFARAIRGTSRMDARELVARNAAAVGSTIRDLFGEAGGAGSLTSKFLKYSGFSPIEKWNRKLASHVGIQYIESTVAKLQRNPTSPRLRRMLDEVLINADDVLKNGLSEESLIKGAMELSNRTQKRTGVIDMPMFMSHPMGRIVAMFKTFAYGSARLMTRDFLLAVHRNPERLLRLLVAFPVVGEIVGDVRNLATGNIRDTEGLARLAENYAYVGTLGILYDFFRSVQFGEGSIKGFMVGPVGSDIAALMDGTYDWLAEGKGRKLGKLGLRMLPPPATLLRGEGAQRAVFGRGLFPQPTKRWQIP